MQVLRFLVDVGCAFHQHGGVHALHLHIVGLGHAFGDHHIAAHEVKRETIAKYIAKIQCQPSWQRLQAEHAQQLGQTGFCLEELAFLHIQMQRARHGFEGGCDG